MAPFNDANIQKPQQISKEDILISALTNARLNQKKAMKKRAQNALLVFVY